MGFLKKISNAAASNTSILNKVSEVLEDREVSLKNLAQKAASLLESKLDQDETLPQEQELTQQPSIQQPIQQAQSEAQVVSAMQSKMPVVPPTEEFSYYALIGNKQQGPYNEIQFKRLIDNEMVSPQTKVWQEGMPRWQVAMDVREVAMLFPQLAAAMQQQSVVATTPSTSSTSEKTYMVGVNGQQAGPYTITQLRQFVATGEFTPQVLVWSQGFANWDLAGNVPELSSLFM